MGKIKAPEGKDYDEVITPLVLTLKHNADIRRLVSLEILKKFISNNNKEKPEGYVYFNWTYFEITNKDGFKITHPYTKEGFVNCYIEGVNELLPIINNIAYFLNERINNNLESKSSEKDNK